jgi:hypothetical protein
MNIHQSLIPALLVSATVASFSVLSQIAPAAAGTLIVCGHNGAARIVETVPSGCRHLSATSAPKHPPDNPITKTRLNFTFTASTPVPQTQLTRFAQSDPTPKHIPILDWQ